MAVAVVGVGISIVDVVDDDAVDSGSVFVVVINLVVVVIRVFYLVFMISVG